MVPRDAVVEDLGRPLDREDRATVDGDVQLAADGLEGAQCRLAGATLRADQDRVGTRRDLEEVPGRRRDQLVVEDGTGAHLEM